MRQMSIRLRAVPFVLAGALIASQATAQGVDPKSDRELTTAGQKIDKASASADSERVTAKIVDQWRGTQFKFDATNPPRELTAQDVQTLRQKGMGYGEVSIVLALTAKQPDAATAKSVDEIYAMRHDGTGWGKLAQSLGYKSLGSVKQSVKTTETGVEKVAASARTEKAEKLGRLDKPEKPERLLKPERPERPGGSEPR